MLRTDLPQNTFPWPRQPRPGSPLPGSAQAGAPVRTRASRRRELKLHVRPHGVLLKAEKYNKVGTVVEMKSHILHAARKSGQAHYVSLHPALSTILQIIQANPPGTGRQRD